MDDDGSPSFSPFELFLVRRKQLRRKSAFSTGVALIGLRRRIERNASARYLPFFLRLYNKNYVCCLSFYHSVKEQFSLPLNVEETELRRSPNFDRPSKRARLSKASSSRSKPNRDRFFPFLSLSLFSFSPLLRLLDGYGRV